MSSEHALVQLRAMSQVMELMDAYDEEDEQNRARKRRTLWVKKWLLIRDNPRYITIKLCQNCDEKVNWPKKNSSFTVPYEEFKEDDHEAFREALRVSVELFDELLDGIETDIAKRVGLHRIITLLCISLFFFSKSTQMREAISPSRRLMATLRFLAAGTDLRILSEVMRISVSSLSHIIPEV